MITPNVHASLLLSNNVISIQHKDGMLSFNYTLLFVRIHYLSILFYLDNELAATMERLLTLIVLWSLVPFALQKKIMSIGQLAI